MSTLYTIMPVRFNLYHYHFTVAGFLTFTVLVQHVFVKLGVSLRSDRSRITTCTC